MSEENESFDKDCSVRVAVRIRPQHPREIIDMCRVCTSVLPNNPQIILGLDKAFTFDYVYDTLSNQCEVYTECVHRLVEGSLHGFNATVLAYGQTGSGKTYTMGSGFDYEHCDQQQGIIPRAVDHIFNRIDEIKTPPSAEMNTDNPENVQYSVAVQFIELYNEEIVDLLDPYNKKKIFKIHENEFGEISVSGVTIKPVHTSKDALKCLQQGALARTTASTQMNDQSSRSHALFTILIRRQRILTSKSEFLSDDLETLTSKFHFVDLAGSERLKRTGATGERAREGISINCGLLALGNCISALGDKSKKATHVPYRDSKLTRLLQDSLGGNSQTIMIACISPSDRDFVETLNTLKYANRSRNIKNKVQINQDRNSCTISQLRREVASLQSELFEIKQGKRLVDTDGNSTVSDTFYENIMLLNDNKRLQQRLKSMQETINFLTEKNSQLLLEKEINAWYPVTDTDQLVRNVVGGYINEIEKLQAKLIESEEMYQQQKKSSDGIICTADSMARSFAGGQYNTSEDPENILELAKREIQKEKEFVTSRSLTHYENAAAESGDSDGNETDIDEANDVQADLNDVNCDIEIKTKLIEQLELSHQRMQLMKQHYEDKLQLLSSKIVNTQKERDEVLVNMGSSITENQKNHKMDKARDEYERKITSMRNELKRLQQAQREHARQQQEIITQEGKLRNLRIQLDELKNIKARLMKTISQQNNRYKIEDTRKLREIAQLRKVQRRQENTVRSLISKMETKDQILKRKTEEVSSLRRSQRSTRSSGRFKLEEKMFFDARSALQSWKNISRAIDKAAHNRQIVLQFDQELERLINERDSLSNILANLETFAVGTSNTIDNEEDSVQSNLNYVQESIKNVQQAIMEFGDTKESEMSNIAKFIGNVKNLEEAKYLLQNLSTHAVKLSYNLLIIENRLSEHSTLLQECQQERIIQQQLLQHFLAQNNAEKITDLFDSLSTSFPKLVDNEFSCSKTSLKSNETYDIPMSGGAIFVDDIVCNPPHFLPTDINAKNTSRTVDQHNMLFGEKK